MGRAYYYFAASLPFLPFGAKPPFSYQEFLTDCERLLSRRDFDLIVQARLEADIKPSGANSVFDAWVTFNRQLHNEIARFRAHRAGINPQEHMRGPDISFEPLCANYVAHASKSEDLLSGEQFLDQMKWQKLDELTVGHYFDLESLIAYALKLQILERYEAIGSGRGRELFERYRSFQDFQEVLAQALS